MQKISKILIIFFVFLFLFNIFKDEYKENYEIRVRIIPNSNKSKDILEKNEIKELVIIFLNDLIDENKDDLKTIKNKINKNINILREDLIKLYGDKIKVSFKFHQFENKTSDNKIIEGGRYLTLLVEINEGKGDNWWGTIYPELFEISSEEKIEYRSYILELIKKRR